MKRIAPSKIKIGQVFKFIIWEDFELIMIRIPSKGRKPSKNVIWGKNLIRKRGFRKDYEGFITYESIRDGKNKIYLLEEGEAFLEML